MLISKLTESSYHFIHFLYPMMLNNDKKRTGYGKIILKWVH